MLAKWPIRNKLLVGIGLLLVIVATLSWSGFHGVYAYRYTARSFRGRADELTLAQDLGRHVSDLRVLVAEARTAAAAHDEASAAFDLDSRQRGDAFAESLERAGTMLAEYRGRLDDLEENNPEDSQLNDSSEERALVPRLETTLAAISAATGKSEWIGNRASLESVRAQLDSLQEMSWELPSYLHQRIHDYAGEVRTQYRALIFLTGVTTISAAIMLLVLFRLCYAWVLRPLAELVAGSRRVAAGEFGYRIVLDTRDEMSELAEAMNDMTARFEAIRDDLDCQVRERTKQVVRSEQLASVGFLAAGVAHEINNPLAAIALSAESLESRLRDLLDSPRAGPAADVEVVRTYLRMIQNEAFRCKGITERLLDFSRIGESTRHDTDLRALVQSVLDMVAHLGGYRDKRIELVEGSPLVAPLNAQEIKQVVLNLVTNALDSLSAGGKLTIELGSARGMAEMVFTDDGCGMTDEVLKHLFEPFFTRRRNGQGTGLGLSITYRIVADHGGHIEATSEGPGRGSRFKVTLPLAARQKETPHRYQAA